MSEADKILAKLSCESRVLGDVRPDRPVEVMLMEVEVTPAPNLQVRENELVIDFAFPMFVNSDSVREMKRLGVLLEKTNSIFAFMIDMGQPIPPVFSKFWIVDLVRRKLRELAAVLRYVHVRR